MKATSETFEKVKYMADLELVVMLTIVLSILVIVSEIIRLTGLVPITFYAPNLSFYLILSILILTGVNLWKMASAGGLETYETRISIIVAMVTTILFSLCYFGLNSLLFIDFHHAFQTSLFQFKSVSGSYFSDDKYLRPEYFFVLMTILTFVVVYCFVPVIIKFGNCYITIMREIYIDEQSVENLRQKREKGQATDQDKEDTDSSTLAENKKTLRLFNFSLTVQMIILFLWIKPLLKPWSNITPQYDLMIDIIRFAFILLHIVIHLFCYKAEISKYMGRAYSYVSTLVQNPSKENLSFVQNKVRAHIHIMGLVSFQTVAKFILPALLLLLTLQRRMAIAEQETFNAYHMNQKNESSFIDWNCMTVHQPIEILKQAYKCPLNPHLEITHVTPGLGFLSFGMESEQQRDQLSIGKDFVKRVNKYGLVHSEFYYVLLSMITFVFYLSTYLLTLAYIFYRRKTEEAA